MICKLNVENAMIFICLFLKIHVRDISGEHIHINKKIQS